MDRSPARLARRLLDRFRRPGGWTRAAGLVLLVSPWAAAASPGEPPATATAPAGDAPKARVASAKPDAPGNHRVLDVAPAGRTPSAGSPEVEAIDRARRMIADCWARYQSVSDYTCTFFKRERVDGKVYDMHIMQMKARTRPSSLYFKFVQPSAGREVIFAEGRNDDKILAHDVGIGRVLAGTMRLDPKGGMAMEENRHPVTEAGIGSLIETIRDRWAHDLTPENARVSFHPHAKVGERPCTLIEASHPRPGPHLAFHKVRIYIDKESNLPIRFEAYDWPARPGQEPPLMEEYTYMNLRTNVGLKEHDFDQKNSQYSFGRF